VVVSLHWGIPGDNLCDYQHQIAHAAIDAGADIIVGHGPHLVHGVELHRGRPIFYSLGKVVFDWPAMRGRGGGILATVDQQAQRISLHLVSTTDEHGQVRLLAPDEPDGASLSPTACRPSQLSSAPQPSALTTTSKSAGSNTYTYLALNTVRITGR